MTITDVDNIQSSTIYSLIIYNI